MKNYPNRDLIEQEISIILSEKEKYSRNPTNEDKKFFRTKIIHYIEKECNAKTINEQLIQSYQKHLDTLYHCPFTINDTNSETIICTFKQKKKRLVTDNLDTIEFLIFIKNKACLCMGIVFNKSNE